MEQRGFNLQFKGWQTTLIFLFAVIAFVIIARLFFQMLYFVAPFLLIATAIINYKIITNYVQGIFQLGKRNLPMGIGAGVLSAVFYPLVIFFLFLQMLIHRKADQVQRKMEPQQEGEYVEFEEVKQEPLNMELLEPLNPKMSTIRCSILKI